LTIPRIFLRGDMHTGDRRDLEEEHLHYLKSVLRMKPGNRLRLFNGKGHEYDALISTIGSTGITVEIMQERTLPERPVRIVLCQGLPRTDKMDFIIQKATELGVDGIVPVMTSRSVLRLNPDRAAAKIVRWRRIALEAARKCGRDDVPEIGRIMPFDDLLAQPAEMGLRLIFWEEETETSLRDILQAARYRDTRHFQVLVGPEGGFIRQEVEQAVSRGFLSVSLGPQVLKVETAALAILSILHYERGTPLRGTPRSAGETSGKEY